MKLINLLINYSRSKKCIIFSIHARTYEYLLSTCVHLHLRTLTMSLTTIGGAPKEASGASKKSLQNAVMETYACLNMMFTRKTPCTGVYEGSWKFSQGRFGGKAGSWWIQQRGVGFAVQSILDDGPPLRHELHLLALLPQPVQKGPQPLLGI